jgi:hypothetical protein
MDYDSKGILVFNLKYEHVISFNSLVKFITKCKYHRINMPARVQCKRAIISLYCALFYQITNTG